MKKKTNILHIIYATFTNRTLERISGEGKRESEKSASLFKDGNNQGRALLECNKQICLFVC